LVQIAEVRSKPDLAAAALTILHALGQAAPREVAAPQECLQFPIHAGPPMAEPVAERLRRLAHMLREELSEVLAEVNMPSIESSDESVRAAIHQIQEIEDELTAPGLNRLGTDERASLFAAIVGLFLDVGGNGGDSRFRDKVDHALGRWTRRKAKRIAEETTVAEIEALDHQAWESELRALSAAQTLDRNGGDLRTVLRALLTLEMSSTDTEPYDGMDLGTLVSTSDSSRRLLARVTNLLCDRLEQSR
jgi:hypothetical protein